MAKRLINRFPGRIILASFLLMIILGTLFLALPICQEKPIKIFDLFFTACSATTVTGLLTIPITNFTPMGHFIIMLLIQIGGLGLITMTLFFLSLFIDIGLTTQLIATEILEIESIKHIKRIIKFIIGITILCEAIGALLIFFTLYKQFPIREAIFKSIFQSISSFCNAGVSIFPNSMAGFSHSPLMLMTTGILAFLGGFGFLALYQIAHYFFWPSKPRKINLHTHIVLWMSLTTVFVGCILFWILEHNNTLSSMNFSYQWLNSLFNAMSFRSTGFITVDFNHLQLATIFMIMCIAFIGSSPGSTGSGIKTTTFAIFLATARAVITGKDFVHINQRTIRKTQVYRALAIITIALAWIATITFLLLISERNMTFLDIFFESVSSFSVLGLSTGITPLLSSIGKAFIISNMIAGRIGSLTLILAFAKNVDEKEFSFPEERVMLS